MLRNVFRNAQQCYVTKTHPHTHDSAHHVHSLVVGEVTDSINTSVGKSLSSPGNLDHIVVQLWQQFLINKQLFLPVHRLILCTISETARNVSKYITGKKLVAHYLAGLWQNMDHSFMIHSSLYGHKNTSLHFACVNARCVSVCVCECAWVCMHMCMYYQRSKTLLRTSVEQTLSWKPIYKQT